MSKKKSLKTKNDGKGFETFYNYFTKGKWSIYAFFLYSDVNKNLIEYIENHFLNIDEMSDGNCLVFLLEELPEINVEKLTKGVTSSAVVRARIPEIGFYQELHEKGEYLKQRRMLLVSDQLPQKEATGEKKDKQFFYSGNLKKNPALGYTIARRYNIRITDLPCMVFFKNIRDKKVLVYNFDTDLNKVQIEEELQTIFQKISEVTNKYKNRSLETKRIKVYKKLKRLITKRKFLRGLKRFLENPITQFVLKIAEAVVGVLTGKDDEE
ncbi:MAG: hypothetical protein FK732_08900 [Asgard group archaeon]|nr:hypothetical protein [Asgard group archaeon]